MSGIRTAWAGQIKLLQTRVDDEWYKVASAIHLFRSGARSVEMAWMLLTIPVQ